MGFWSRLGKIMKPIAKVAAEAVAETAASGKPITLGNIGRNAGGAAAKELGK
jgi:hypothetical protein